MISPIRNNIIVEFHVPDFKVVKKFYGALGFVEIDYDEPTAEHPAYLVMKRADSLGDTMINFYGGDSRVYSQSYFKQFSKDTKRGYAIEVTMPVEDVEQFFQKVNNEGDLKKHIVRGVKEISEGGSTWKDFRMEDPFGFYLRFTDLLDWGQ